MTRAVKFRLFAWLKPLSPFWRGATAAIAVAVLGAGCASTNGAARRGLKSWPVTALSGEPASIQGEGDTRAIVFEFLSVECPISNRVEPELDRLEQEYAARGIRFVAVYPNAGDSADLIRQHRSAGSLDPAAYRDPELKLADQLGVTVTPEVVVVAPDGDSLYRGRVNDQYAALGKGRPAPTRHDLAEALAEIAAGTLKEPRATAPVGCRLQRAP